VRSVAWAAGLIAAGGLAAACHARASGATSTATAPVPAATARVDPLRPLRDFEAARRASTDFARLAGSETTLGPDPYTLRRIPPSLPARGSAPERGPGARHEGPRGSSARFVGVLRGASAVVVLDEALHEQGRLDAPASPSSIAVSAGGDVFVAGELSHVIQRYRFTGGALRPHGTLVLPDVCAIRGLATGPEGVLYAVEEHDGRLLTLEIGAGDPVSSQARDPSDGPIPFHRIDMPIGRGPLRVARVGQYVVVDCLLDHSLVVRRVDAKGVPVVAGEARIVHDGPIWGFDALELPSSASNAAGAPDLLVAAGGVEDHPLDRTEGSFGFVDSFVYLYRVGGGGATRLAAIDTSAFGLVTPKAVSLTRDARGSVEMTVAAYGSDRWARLVWASDASGAPAASPGGAGAAARAGAEPTVTVAHCPPGSASMERLDDGSLAIANPLLDAWVRVPRDGAGPVDVVHAESSPSSPRSVDSRVGEALFFTSLIAPWNQSAGRLSVFACETCHFEGYVDGRTHRTGRGDIRATTRPLLGLFNDRPYFSRALDPDLAAVADNEFRVAGAKSGHDPHFTVSPRDFPWLTELGVATDEDWGPDRLRRALMTFLMDFAPRPNPAVVGRARWSPDERAGAEVFRDRCEACHAARLVADDASTRIPFEQWERRVMAPEGPIVWARAEYARTGVEPYVSERGARVAALRRLFKKAPYFTNGSAGTLGVVLDRVRYDDGARSDDATGFLHEAPASAPLRALTPGEKEALLAFLDLL
jgi:hypothetical protein